MTFFILNLTVVCLFRKVINSSFHPCVKWPVEQTVFKLTLGQFINWTTHKRTKVGQRLIENTVVQLSEKQPTGKTHVFTQKECFHKKPWHFDSHRCKKVCELGAESYKPMKQSKQTCQSYSCWILYLCLFLFFRFLWLAWWLPEEEEEEAAFWGFRSCSVESTSSVSSWLGSFSWFWRSGEVSLSVPLPASPDEHSHEPWEQQWKKKKITHYKSDI